jgi:TolB-like protein/tetratricopeptide (TPR) repeat protein
MVKGGTEETASTNVRTVFISYASQDAAVANAVVGILEGAGLACWIAPRDVVPGALYAGEIIRAINESSLVVMVLSAHSVASPHVGKELERASSKRRRIIALRTDAALLPHDFEYFLGESQWIDAGTGSIESAAAKLAKAVRHHLGSGLEDATSASQTLFRARHNAVTTDPPTESLPSIAVLPFANFSDDKEQEYFSDGLAEEIINALAQIVGLKVIARTSAFAFKGQNTDIRRIAETLGVANILEGSVRRSGNRIRVTAQLINATDGAHLWSRRYDRELTDVFAVQEEIAMAVAGALSITLDVGEMSRAKGGTTNVDAYDKYLHARALFYRLGPKELQLSAQLYREALALDPNFARAWNGLHTVLSYSLTWIPENSAVYLKDMEEAMEHIMGLAPDAWWTQVMRTDQFRQQRKWSEAEAAACAAIAAAPASQIEALTNYGLFLVTVGRAKESVEYLRRAREIDPLSLAVSGVLQLFLDFAGRPAEAQAEYERTKDFPGDHAIWDWYTVRRLWRCKDVPLEVVEAQFRLFSKNESLPMALNQIILENLGNKEAAGAAIREALKDPSNQDTTRLGVVGQFADHFGDRDVALAAFRRSMVDLPTIDFSLLWNPYETGLRTDPRFKDILRELGLVDYFRKSGNWGDFCKPVSEDDFKCH